MEDLTFMILPGTETLSPLCLSALGPGESPDPASQKLWFHILGAGTSRTFLSNFVASIIRVTLMAERWAQYRSFPSSSIFCNLSRYIRRTLFAAYRLSYRLRGIDPIAPLIIAAKANQA